MRKIYLTEGDTLMPQFDLAQWRERSAQAFSADQHKKLIPAFLFKFARDRAADQCWLTNGHCPTTCPAD